MKYRIAEALKIWNRNAKEGHKITNKQALRVECAKSHAETGHRRIEMSGYETKTGHPVTIEF